MRRQKGLLQNIAACLTGLIGIACIASGSARATPINYEFQGAAAVLDGLSYDITGTFTADVATGELTNVDVVFTGPPPFAGTYTTSKGIIGSNNNGIAIFDSSISLEFILEFQDALDVSADKLTAVNLNPSLDNAANFGGIVEAPSASVSESPSIALLGAALFGLGLTKVRRRRCSS